MITSNNIFIKFIHIIFYILEGVIVAPNDPQLKSHPQIEGVRNHYVVTLMKAFVVKGLVKENYAWRHHYFYITNEGIDYLRELLHLPSTIVPATLKRSARSDSSLIREERPAGRGRGGRGRGGRGGSGYRGREGRGGSGYRS